MGTPGRIVVADIARESTPALEKRKGAAALAAVGITRRFAGTVALDGVSLDIHAGRIHALLGPNGAGKTTLIRILAGLVAPSEGSVVLLGHEPRRHDLCKRVGLAEAADPAVGGWSPGADRDLGEAIAGLAQAGFAVLDCRREHSEVEEAFLALMEEASS